MIKGNDSEHLKCADLIAVINVRNHRETRSITLKMFGVSRSIIESPDPVFTAQKDLVGVVSTLSSSLLQDTYFIVTLFW